MLIKHPKRVKNNQVFIKKYKDSNRVVEEHSYVYHRETNSAILFCINYLQQRHLLQPVKITVQLNESHRTEHSGGCFSERKTAGDLHSINIYPKLNRSLSQNLLFVFHEFGHFHHYLTASWLYYVPSKEIKECFAECFCYNLYTNFADNFPEYQLQTYDMATSTFLHRPNKNTGYVNGDIEKWENMSLEQKERFTLKFHV